MTMKPILFSTPMVRAIVAGRKTMTRRVVKPYISNQFDLEADGKTIVAYIDQETGDSYQPHEIAPYQVGDVLWVRETWCKINNKYYFKADQLCTGCDDDGTCRPRGVQKNILCDACEYNGGLPKWRPSIFMPKSAARIWLEVTAVRCERLQEITEEDAICEGCLGEECVCLHAGRGWMGCEGCMNTGWQEPPTLEFIQLWDSINAKRGYPWSSNLFVWVISFERCEKPGQLQGKTSTQKMLDEVIDHIMEV